MSIDFRPENEMIKADDLLAELGQHGIREHQADGSSETAKCLTDGRNYLWAYFNDAGYLTCLTRYAGNSPGKILGAICDAFDTDIYSEHQPEYWGFKTQEEWDEAWKADADRHDEQFYGEVVKYAAGEPNEVPIGRIGEIWAKIGGDLIAKDPTLAGPTRWRDLRAQVQAIYDNEHAVKVTLTKLEMAMARMMATSEEDLPQA